MIDAPACPYCHGIMVHVDWKSDQTLMVCFNNCVKELPMDELKPLVLYHGNCRDGFCAAWVAHEYFGDNADYIPVYHGGSPPDVKGRNLFVLDFAYPRATMEKMAFDAVSIVVLDHHKTAQEDLRGLPYVAFDMKRSGAGMAWDYFHKEAPRPWLVDYVEDRDLWAKKLHLSDEVNAYISTMEFDFKSWSQVSRSMSPEHVAAMGIHVVQRTRQYVREVSKNAIKIRWHGYHVPCVNAAHMDISELVGNLAKGESFAVGWWQRADGKIVYALRSDVVGADVSAIARHHGGGGHRSAAGFQADAPMHMTMKWALPCTCHHPGVGNLPFCARCST